LRKPLFSRRRLPLLIAEGALLIALSVGVAVHAMGGNTNSGVNGDLAARGGELATSARLSEHKDGNAKSSSKPGNSSGTKNNSSSKQAKSADKKDDKKKDDNKASKPASKPAAMPAPAPAPVPASAPAPSVGNVHSNIISTVFWVGEAPDASNAYITNTMSAWDETWQSRFGGVDDPLNRSGYRTASFVPKENSFYFALPYNDYDESGRRKPTAKACANAGPATGSWCKNSWIKITKGAKVAYAQWQDVGPMLEDDYDYVFGTAAPKNTWDSKAGLDVSPATRDFLGLQDVDRVSWNFVSASSVPAGPWKDVITTYPGDW